MIWTCFARSYLRTSWLLHISWIFAKTMYFSKGFVVSLQKVMLIFHICCCLRYIFRMEVHELYLRSIPLMLQVKSMHFEILSWKFDSFLLYDHWSQISSVARRQTLSLTFLDLNWLVSVSNCMVELAIWMQRSLVVIRKCLTCLVWASVYFIALAPT